ncbi:hypothetical protein BC833DRAFT_69776 [Globomyces pollinis-pini]|nr:hypothetical protein BC833DRAFT_69776 [Globomyces pollinis-pini]
MDEYNQIIRILETEPLTGDLDFILSTQVIYIDGNFGIPIQSIKQLYTIAFKQFKLNHNKLMNSKLIMLLYPDCYTILNERKSLLLQNQIDKYEEYSFTRFVLTKHSSNSLLWSYRYWIRKQIKIDDTTRQQDDEICNLAAQRYKCNYPCWTFRRLSMLKNSNFELVTVYESD